MHRNYLSAAIAASTLASAWAMPKLDQLQTIEKQVGKCMVIHCKTNDNTDITPLLNTVKPGGIILYDWINRIDTIDQATKTTTDIRRIARELGICPLICVDQEGGRVDRIKDLASLSAYEKTQKYSDSEFFDHQLWLSNGLKDCGIDINFSPVVDINSNPYSSISDRSFGQTPEAVIKRASIAIRASQTAEVLCGIKHWPGHGDIKADSHDAVAKTTKSLQELEACEIAPFRALAAKADLVMTGHIIATALDPVNCATTSKPSLDYLRNFYDSVIVSDSLTMEGLLQNIEGQDQTERIANAAIKAINAGCDLVVLGGKTLNAQNQTQEITPDEMIDIHRRIVDAVEDKRLPLERVKKANIKVDALTRKLQKHE
jgi:beta-N-acetylhexosaminidase